MATSAASSPSEFNTGFFSSPTDLLNAAKLANQTVNSIDGAVSAAGSKVPDNFSTSWLSFKAVWDAFFKDRFQDSNITEEWFTSDLEGELRTYEGKIATFGDQLAALGVTIPGGVPHVQSNSLPDWFPSAGTVLGIAFVVFATIVAWKVL